MTIKIEQEAILRFLNTARLSLPCHQKDGEAPKPPSTLGIVVATTQLFAEPPSLPPCRVGDDVSVDQFSVPHVLNPTVDKFFDVDNDDFCPDLQSLDSDEEDCISVSSCSVASSCGGGRGQRKVSFVHGLVTDVKTRPRTDEADKALLFYSEKETSRFRLEYRQERKLLSDDENYVHNVNLCGSTEDEPQHPELPGRRRISRVVVEHNDSLETFFDCDNFAYSLHSGGGSVGDVFFDNDSFWSGSITWY